jgi:hypothetical protein
MAAVGPGPPTRNRLIRAWAFGWDGIEAAARSSGRAGATGRFFRSRRDRSVSISGSSGSLCQPAPIGADPDRPERVNRYLRIPRRSIVAR